MKQEEGKEESKYTAQVAKEQRKCEFPDCDCVWETVSREGASFAIPKCEKATEHTRDKNNEP